MTVGSSDRPGRNGRRRFIIFGAAFAAASIGFVAWTTMRVGGDQVTIAVDDIGEAVAAATAAIACWLAARRAKDRLRRAWVLLAASAASWCLGEVVWSVYEVGLQVPVPFPSVADVGFLASVPLAIAGVLSFRRSDRGTSAGLRLWLDRSIVALSLFFLAWELGLGQVFVSSGETLPARLVGVAYPIGDILLGTVLILAIRRATAETEGQLILLLGGLAASALADSAFAYLTAAGKYTAIGTVLDAGWVVGFLMIALAALWPAPGRDAIAEERPVDIWQLVLPWIAILVGGVAAGIQAIRGHPLDVFATVLAGGIIGLMMVSQVLGQYESLSLAFKSKLAARTLNDVIVHAPLGVVRIAADMSILQANPTFASLLHATVDALTGAPIGQFFSAPELARIAAGLNNLSSGSVDTTVFDSQATRADGTSVWLHWTATAVRKADGEIDYFVVMFDDVSARRSAEESAAANFEVLQRLNRVKSQFMTKVRHEFRTALVGIEGFSEYIRETEKLDSADVRAMANDIYVGAHKLSRTLDEMLDVDRPDGSHTTLRVEEVELDGLLREAVALVQMGSNSHAIAIEGDRDLPAVAADPDMLTQVLTSLVGRAIEYSPSGAPVRVTARRVKDEVEITVADQGHANPADLEAQLLGRARPVVVHGPARALASDVGLPMARQIVEMHGGRIWFDTDMGVRWHFTIPVTGTAAAPSRQDPALSRF